MEAHKYKIIFDAGKPYEVLANTDDALKNELIRFYDENKDNDYNYDVMVLNADGEDISESQFITELLGEVIQDE